MKIFLIFTCLLIVSCTGCSKNEMGCTPVEPKAEEARILAYAAQDSMNVTKHSSGIYYQIIDQGTGTAPDRNSNVTVQYTGKLLNESIFDQSTGYSNTLNNLIEGWQIGIPLIKNGGHIKLIIPSAYAYGCNAQGGIPSNSILYFDINLVNVQ